MGACTRDTISGTSNIKPRVIASTREPHLQVLRLRAVRNHVSNVALHSDLKPFSVLLVASLTTRTHDGDPLLSNGFRARGLVHVPGEGCRGYNDSKHGFLSKPNA
eukprot:13362096-Alexandrium_andersonii.AAC.1